MRSVTGKPTITGTAQVGKAGKVAQMFNRLREDHPDAHRGWTRARQIRAGGARWRGGDGTRSARIIEEIAVADRLQGERTLELEDMEGFRHLRNRLLELSRAQARRSEEMAVRTMPGT